MLPETNEFLKKDGKATSTEIIQTGKPYHIGGEEFVVDFLVKDDTADNAVWFPKYNVLMADVCKK
jgi:metallo-beta-lactamase class B IND